MGKYQHVTSSHHNLDSENDTEEVEDTPLTRADIPNIINAILRNFSKDATSSRDYSQNNSHISEQLVNFTYMSCGIDKLLVTAIITVPVQYKWYGEHIIIPNS